MNTDNISIKSIKIEKLFNLFDYDIEFSNENNILIITGTNGFGKTHILNIVFNLFNRRLFFFHSLLFSKIVVHLSNNTSIEVIKKTKNDRQTIDFIFYKKKDKVGTYKYGIDDKTLLSILLNYDLRISPMGNGYWIDHSIDKGVLRSSDVVSKYVDILTDELVNIYKIKSEKANIIIDSLNTHLIREQRLFYEVAQKKEIKSAANLVNTTVSDVISICSDNLQKRIHDRVQESFDSFQKLDSTYTNRLINEKETISEEKYNETLSALKEKQERLNKVGLSSDVKTIAGGISYSKDDSKALLVYLDDLKEKLSFFDDLLEKIELFTSILNKKRFSFKKINISRENGFVFKANFGDELTIKHSDLSSGEKHEVILLYELIFNTEQNTLVLIDEPELSLHITWQKEFLKDLSNIMAINNIQVLIATHSPSIINDRWDLVYTLEKNM